MAGRKKRTKQDEEPEFLLDDDGSMQNGMDERERAAMIAAGAVPLALLGAGLGWLMVQQLSRGESDSRRTSTRVRSAAKRRGMQARSGMEQAMDRSPLAVGAAVFALGVLGGVTLPSSQWENEVLGEKSDELKDGVRERAKDIRERATSAARGAADSLRSETQSIGARLLTGSALELARTALESAGSRARTEGDRTTNRSRTRS